ncbi:hypothetical protein MASR2M117_14280 [Paludibacter sp.]
MRKFYLLLVATLIQLNLINSIAGNGTVENPYTVSEAIKIKDTTKEYYVQGYIVGEMRDYSNGKYFYELTPPFSGTTSLLIADNPKEIDLSKCMPIQSGDKYDDLYDKPTYWRKQIVISGYFKDYFSMPGVKDLKSFVFSAGEPSYNESQYWNLFESFDEKEYVPNSSLYTFAGGIYNSSVIKWNFVGSTWGDTGKDQKWERAAARIRLTEGANGEPGYIETTENKSNGIGYVRFWAGNYEEDTSGGALALLVSADNGKTWEKVAHSQNITRTWKEYEFIVNRQGNLRLRIAKDENGSKGINVDKVKISDYYELHDGVTDLNNSDLTYYTTSEGLYILNKNYSLSVYIYDISGQIVYSNNSIVNETFIPLRNGIFIIKTNIGARKITVH